MRIEASAPHAHRLTLVAQAIMTGGTVLSITIDPNLGGWCAPYTTPRRAS